MKKILFLASLMCASIAMATPTITGTSQIDLSSAGQTDKYVRFIISSSFSDGFDNSYDAQAANENGIYVFGNGNRYTMWASDAYTANLPLGFYTCENTSYTLKFSNFMGVEYTIYDRVEDDVITVNASTPAYNFTIDESEKNSQINNRFIINYNEATYIVASVTTNAYGLATFSYDQNLTAIEAGVKLYKGAISGEYLNLTQVNYVKAGEGVLVYGEANTTYHFSAGTGSSDFSGNELKAASAWAYPHAGYNAYVLSGNSLYLYEGDAMKPNKAFLLLSTGAGAPKRISFRFNQPTAVENAKATDVKAQKFVENGQIFIRRGNEVFNLQGQIVK